MDLRFYFSNQKEDGRQVSPPYEAGVEGYELFAKFLGRGLGGTLNCHHGAPDDRVGGWQAVNIPADVWLRVWKEWKVSDREHGIPFFWCGKPNLLKRRLVTTVRYGSNESTTWWLLDREVVRESTLRELVGDLNKILRQLEQPTVRLNVPDKVDWGAYYPSEKISR